MLGNYNFSLFSRWWSRQCVATVPRRSHGILLKSSDSGGSPGLDILPPATTFGMWSSWGPLNGRLINGRVAASDDTTLKNQDLNKGFRFSSVVADSGISCVQFQPRIMRCCRLETFFWKNIGWNQSGCGPFGSSGSKFQRQGSAFKNKIPFAMISLSNWNNEK